MDQRRTTMRRVAVSALMLLAVSSVCVSAARSNLRGRVFRGVSPGDDPQWDHVSSSDPANNPLSLDAFLQGQEDGVAESGGGALLQTWQMATQDAPMTQRLEQEVLLDTQSSAQQEYVGDQLAMLEQQYVEGKPASKYEPGNWPRNPITPDPYQHLTHTHGGGRNPHNNIKGALGVQSAAIPWDYRHYSGNLNSHRKAEPLIYTPLVIAQDDEGKSAVDLTSLVNRRYQSQRMSSNPQYANTLSALTDYKPVQMNPTDHWLPQMPVSAAPGVRNQKYWEAHFLDLHAPMPPPLLSPRVPRMKRGRKGARPTVLLEQPAPELPALLQGGEHVQPMIMSVLDENNAPVPFHDLAAEAEAVREGREVNFMAPAGSPEAEEHQPIVFLEEEADISLDEVHDALEQIEQEEAQFDFPPAREQQFDW